MATHLSPGISTRQTAQPNLTSLILTYSSARPRYECPEHKRRRHSQRRRLLTRILALTEIQHPLPQHGKAKRLQSALFGERDASISEDEILDALLSNETLPQPPSFPNPEEFPTAEGKCPFEECGIELVNNPSVDSAHHIHQPVKRAFAGLAREAYAATVDLDDFPFGGCDRGEFQDVNDLGQHLVSGHMYSAAKHTRECGIVLPDGSLCAFK